MPRRRVTTTFAADFGRPDQWFEVTYGGLRWLANVELWVVDGALRARADVPLDVVCYPDRASAVEFVVRVGVGGTATVSATPPLPGRRDHRPRVVRAADGHAQAGGGLADHERERGGQRRARSSSAPAPCLSRQAPPAGPLRIAAVTLPTAAAPLDHEVTLQAAEGLEVGGYTVRWTNAVTPGASELYAAIPSVTLGRARG